MTQENKELLLRDLSARLPYGVEVTWDGLYSITLTPSIYVALWKEKRDQNIPKVYLRPMSSMTEEEIVELKCLNEKCDAMPTFEYVPVENYRIYDWMNRHHFDFRNLIERGLALEAPADMYNIKEK